MLKTGWTVDGQNFSDRLWANKSKLIDVLNKELKTAIIRGQANSEGTFKKIQNLLNASYNAVRRIVLTESAYFSELAKNKVYESFEVEKYEVIGSLDSKTCSTCGGHDGEVWEFSQYEVGTTAPIYHPNCRCTTAPYFEDEDFNERFARDEKGNPIKVPDNMTYEEWKKQFYNNKDLTAEGGSDTIKPTTIESAKDINKVLGASSVKQREEATEELKNALLDYSHNDYIAPNNEINNLPVYEVVNSHFRNGTDLRGYSETVEQLDAFTSSYTLPTPLNVYRVVKTEAIESVEVGQIFTDPAYMSTTVLSSAIDDLRGSLEAHSVLNLTIHGNAGAYVGELSEYPHEYEFLLKRGLSFIITGKEVDKNGDIKLWGDLLDE